MRPSQPPDPTYRVYGMSRSYFTRKLTSYLAYKGIPHRFRRFAGAHPRARAAGWPGGVPVAETPDGQFMWDTTAVMLHLEERFPERSVLPSDPVQRFLCFVLEDVLDEWFYRPAVGSRWFFEENRRYAAWDLARDLTCEIPIPADQTVALVTRYMSESCQPFGATADNIQSWIDEVLRPWLRCLQTHLETHPFFFGGRPSLADFALLGANAAHFVADPLCRRWVDADAPAVVAHTHRLLEPEDFEIGDWCAPEKTPETLVAVLADLGRLYLPWVSRATVAGEAEIGFASGPRPVVAASPFLREARAVLLARYRELRSDALDAVLERAGILRYFADDVDQAGEIPDPSRPPQPALNRPFAPPSEAEGRAWESVGGPSGAASGD